MNKETRILIYPLLIIVIALVVASSCKKDKITNSTIPTLTTTVASNITSTTATSGGNITTDGGSPVTARGVCWSTSQSPIIENFKTIDGSGIGSFTSSITGLSVGKYYVRAYATNSVGTAYGNQIIVNIYTATVLATLTTTAMSSITASTASSGGIITNTGGAFVLITERGVCWSINQTPTIADNKTSNGTGGGSFTSSITGLTSNTPYYLRAYATNSAGTAYGNQVAFTTPHGIGESYQGGIIAYILQPGDPGYIAGQTHGLIATTSDQSVDAAWGCEGTTTGAVGTAIGTGNQNTIDIIAHCSTAGIAAKLCSELISGGYNDWYLPSKDELNKLYINRAAIGGFSTSQYWSSSEATWNTHAWTLYFDTGNFVGLVKEGSNYVRAVRSF